MMTKGKKAILGKCLKQYDGSIRSVLKDAYEKYDGDVEKIAVEVLRSNDPEVKKTQFYAEASKEFDGHWYRLRYMVGSKCRKCGSDAGSLKIGNEEWSILIPNGVGDGITRYAVFDNESEINTDMLRYFTSVRGKFNIYDYDCGTTIDQTLDGSYLIYIWEGIIAFVKTSGKGGAHGEIVSGAEKKGSVS